MLIVVGAIVWFVFAIAIPLLVINIGVLALIAAHGSADRRKVFLSLSLAGALFVLLDYNAGWLTRSLAGTFSFFASAMPSLLYLNILAGLVATYFLLRDVLNEQRPQENAGGELSRRNLTIIGSLAIVGALEVGLQTHFAPRGAMSSSQALAMAVNPVPDRAGAMAPARINDGRRSTSEVAAPTTVATQGGVASFDVTVLSAPSIEGCSSLFAESRDAFAAGRYLYADNLAERGYVSIDGRTVALKKVAPRDSAFFSTYSNEEYTASIRITSSVPNGREGETISGELIVRRKGGSALTKAIYGERGC